MLKQGLLPEPNGEKIEFDSKTSRGADGLPIEAKLYGASHMTLQRKFPASGLHQNSHGQAQIIRPVMHVTLSLKDTSHHHGDSVSDTTGSRTCVYAHVYM